MAAIRMVILLLLAAQAHAQSRPDCTCNNLESLQQDYRNAVYLEKFFRDLSAQLQAWEAKELADKAKGLSSLNIPATSRAMEARAAETKVRLPVPTVKDYTGPTSVTMTVGTCSQPERDLKALEVGSPCEGMAAAALAHELHHRDICNQMGVDAYWSRKGSEIALEEAENYKAQAANLKSEIGRVLEASDVRLVGEWMYTLAGDGVEATHFATFDSGDMKLSSSGDGGWKLTGKGDSVDTIVDWKLPDNCFISGKMTGDLSVSLGTDGLTFGVEMTESNFHENYTVTCPEGQSWPDDSGESFGFSGSLGTGLPLKSGDNEVPSPWADYYKANALSFWSSVSGEPSTSLRLSCEKP